MRSRPKARSGAGGREQPARGQPTMGRELLPRSDLQTLSTHHIGELVDLARERRRRPAHVVHTRQPPAITLTTRQHPRYQSPYIRGQPPIPQQPRHRSSFLHVPPQRQAVAEQARRTGTVLLVPHSIGRGLVYPDEGFCLGPWHRSVGIHGRARQCPAPRGIARAAQVDPGLGVRRSVQADACVATTRCYAGGLRGVSKIWLSLPTRQRADQRPPDRFTGR